METVLICPGLYNVSMSVGFILFFSNTGYFKVYYYLLPNRENSLGLGFLGGQIVSARFFDYL